MTTSRSSAGVSLTQIAGVLRVSFPSTRQLGLLDHLLELVFLLAAKDPWTKGKTLCSALSEDNSLGLPPEIVQAIRRCHQKKPSVALERIEEIAVKELERQDIPGLLISKLARREASLSSRIQAAKLLSSLFARKNGPSDGKEVLAPHVAELFSVVCANLAFDSDPELLIATLNIMDVVKNFPEEGEDAWLPQTLDLTELLGTLIIAGSSKLVQAKALDVVRRFRDVIEPRHLENFLIVRAAVKVLQAPEAKCQESALRFLNSIPHLTDLIEDARGYEIVALRVIGSYAVREKAVLCLINAQTRGAIDPEFLLGRFLPLFMMRMGTEQMNTVLRKVDELYSQSEDCRVYILESYVPVLLDCVDSPEDDCLNPALALSLIVKIAEREDFRFHLVNCILNKLEDADQDSAKITCLKVIATLLASNSSLREVFAQELPDLRDIIKHLNSMTDQLRISTARVLSVLADVPSIAKKILGLPEVSFVVDRLLVSETVSLEELSELLRLLSRFSSVNETRDRLFGKRWPMVLRKMLNLLQTPNEQTSGEIQDLSLSVLLGLALRSESVRADLVSAGGVQLLREFLGEREKHPVAMALLLKLDPHAQEQVEQSEAAGEMRSVLLEVMPPIVTPVITPNGSGMTEEEARRIVLKLIKRKKRWRQKLMNPDNFRRYKMQALSQGVALDVVNAVMKELRMEAETQSRPDKHLASNDTHPAKKRRRSKRKGTLSLDHSPDAGEEFEECDEDSEQEDCSDSHEFICEINRLKERIQWAIPAMVLGPSRKESIRYTDVTTNAPIPSFRWMDLEGKVLEARHLGMGEPTINLLGRKSMDCIQPQTCDGVVYFEAELLAPLEGILHADDRPLVSVGFAEIAVKETDHIGDGDSSVGLDSDGAFKQEWGRLEDNFPKFTFGDTMGAGLETETGRVFFTRNGELIRFRKRYQRYEGAREMAAAVGLSDGAAVVLRCGKDMKYKFDLEGYLQSPERKIVCYSDGKAVTEDQQGYHGPENTVYITPGQLHVQHTETPTRETIVHEARCRILTAEGVPADLARNIRREMVVLAQKTGKTYRPEYGGKVQELIDPSLYPYIDGISVERDPASVRSKKLNWYQPVSYKERMGLQQLHYQWLPAEFKVHPDGIVEIASYINNLDTILHPRLPGYIGRLFSLFVPMFEKCLKQSLRGKDLQVIVQASDVVLRPGESLQTGWELAGMPHELIVATGVYYYECSPHLQDEGVAFRRDRVQSDDYPRDPKEVCYFDPALYSWRWNIELGRVSPKEGLMLVFPNTAQHKLLGIHCPAQERSTPSRGGRGGNKSKRKEMGKDATGYQKALRFYLVSPDRCIISTEDVPEQQWEIVSRRTLIALDETVEEAFGLTMPAEILSHITSYVYSSDFTYSEALRHQRERMLLQRSYVTRVNDDWEESYDPN